MSNGRSSRFKKPEPTWASDGVIDVKADEAMIRSVLASHAGKINARCMNAEIKDDAHLQEVRDKMRHYYTALVAYAHKNMPPAAAAELADFVETRCKCW